MSTAARPPSPPSTPLSSVSSPRAPWGSVWSRLGLTRRERSLITLALLAALGHDDEVAMHCRATRNTGASPEDIAEAMLHVAVYAGVPAANHAITIGPETKGERILIGGRVFDGAGQPLTDALVEIWQADAAGLYKSPEERRGTADPHFAGWGRQPADDKTGAYRFETIKPGRAPSPDGRLMAPHITVWIVARGINIGLHTRLYFGDEDRANAEDPVLARIEPRSRVATLIAPRGEEQGLAASTFDIHLQGPDETVFFHI